MKTKKRILFLGDASSAHLERWAIGMQSQGFELAVFSLRPAASPAIYSNKGIQVFTPDLKLDKSRFWASLISKSVYIKALPSLKRVIKNFKPDIVHAHYASSYGLLGALSGFKPYCISVWGSDVLEFPKINFLTKKIVEYNFRKADRILVTSQELLQSASLYTDKSLEIIAFGIEPDLYSQSKHAHGNALFFGSAKALTHIYGHDTALHAFASAKTSIPLGSRFLIAGSGPDEPILKNIAHQLGIEDDVEFKGQLTKEEIPNFLSNIDVLINLSRSESFGVVVLEAAACEVPAIVSETGGLREVVKQNETGILVQTNSVEAAKDAMIILANDSEKRKTMGIAARKFALENYPWKASLEKMTAVYESLFKSNV